MNNGHEATEPTKENVSAKRIVFFAEDFLPAVFYHLGSSEIEYSYLIEVSKKVQKELRLKKYEVLNYVNCFTINRAIAFNPGLYILGKNKIFSRYPICDSYIRYTATISNVIHNILDAPPVKGI